MDKKGRVSIPSRFREILRSDYEDQVVLSPGDGCLVAYPIEEWEEHEDAILRKISRFSKSKNKYMRYRTSRAQECPIDSQGRVLVPPKLRDKARLKDKILFVGMIDHFEIWNQDAYEKEDAAMSDDIMSELEEDLFHQEGKNGE